MSNFESRVKHPFTTYDNKLIQKRGIFKSPYQKLAYMFLDSYSNANKIFPSMDSIAEAIVASRRTAITVIEELEKMTLIEVKRESGKSNNYILNDYFEIAEKLTSANLAPVQKSHSETGETQDERTRAGDAPVQEMHYTSAGDALLPVQEMHPITKTTKNKKEKEKLVSTTTKKTSNELVISSSHEILTIDKTFQDLYKDVPLEEIKAKLFEDAENRKVKMKTEAQYFALMAKRIQFHLDAQSNTPTTLETSQFGEFATGLGQIPLEQRSREFKAFLSRTSEVPNSEPSSKPSSEIANGSKPTSEKLRSSSSESLETQLAVLTQPEKTPEEIAEAKKEIQRLMDEIRNEKK